MPTYLFRCYDCDSDYEEWHSIHGDITTARCPECDGLVDQVFHPPLTSITVTPTSADPEAFRALAREKRWDADMPAYKRLRDDGLQPNSIDGAAHVETHAETETEVTMGRVMPFRRVKEGAARSAEVLGQDVVDA